MRELRNEQVNRGHEETASARAISLSSGSAGRFDTARVRRELLLEDAGLSLSA